MRASRLVSILLLLQVRGRMSAGELAERLEVSTRTIYRDLDALSEAGVPVSTQSGPRGGCWLLDGYRTRLTGLTADEAGALFLAGLPGPAGELGLGTALAAAQLKLLAALPDELRTRAGWARDRFHLDAPRWFDRPGGAHEGHLVTAAGAVWDDRLLEVRYQREGLPAATHVVEPLGLVLKAGVWYMVVGAPGRPEPHVYRLSRVVSATRLEQPFDRPAGFDLAGFWARWSRAFEASRPRVPVVLRLAPEAVPAARVAAADLLEEDAEADGWVRATLLFERLESAAGSILSLGAGAEVLEPAELRERVAATAQAMVERYRDARA